jgi:hypothetical protein
MVQKPDVKEEDEQMLTEDGAQAELLTLELQMGGPRRHLGAWVTCCSLNYQAGKI